MGRYIVTANNDLLRICGEGRLRFWPLVDQLIFCEDVEQNPEGGNMDDDKRSNRSSLPKIPKARKRWKS